MRASIALLTLLVAIATASVQVPTTVERNPSVVALLRTIDFETYVTACGGCILNNRSVLTAARCFQEDGPERWRFRVGSSNWNSGGDVYQVTDLILHEDWDEWAMMTDIAIVRTARGINLNDNVQNAQFGSYVIPVNAPVRILGWGYIGFPLWLPTQYEDLREIQLTNLDLDVCRPFYRSEGFGLRNTQLCIGFSNVDSNTISRNKCFGEPGMPVFHGPLVVGIRSYGVGCLSNPEIPSISTHFGEFVTWVRENA